MRIGYSLSLILCLAACNRGTQSKDAVRQGVVDYLVAKGFSMSAMKVELTEVQFKGNEAAAKVAITPAAGGQGMAMQFQYQLRQQGDKWVVTNRQEGGSPHGGGAVPPAQPGMANPHGGGGMPTSAPGAGGMPSPQDLPPVDKKK